MKKQINPTIKAHLIRGAFYLLLLLAVCAVPFALAQRNTKRGVANPVSKFASQSHAGSQLNDVRGVPNLPRMSQVPQNTSGVRAAHVLPIPRLPKAPQVVLYDQYNNNGPNATLSATFTDFPTSSADLADDFVVPGGQTWNVQSIDADGVYFNGPGPATNWNVFIYSDSSTSSWHASLQHAEPTGHAGWDDLHGKPDSCGGAACRDVLDRDPGQHDLWYAGRMGLDRSDSAV